MLPLEMQWKRLCDTVLGLLHRKDFDGAAQSAFNDLLDVLERLHPELLGEQKKAPPAGELDAE